MTEYEEGRLRIVFRPGTSASRARDIIAAVGASLAGMQIPREPQLYTLSVPREYEESFIRRFRTYAEVLVAERVVKRR